MDRINKLRFLLRDYEPLNTLHLNQLEFSDSDLEIALELAVRKLNTVNPVSSYTLENLPNIFEMALYDLAISLLLKSRIRELSRNNVDYYSGGIVMSLDKIISEYVQTAQILESQAIQNIQTIKIQKNNESFCGNFTSAYSVFGWY